MIEVKLFDHTGDDFYFLWWTFLSKVLFKIKILKVQVGLFKSSRQLFDSIFTFSPNPFHRSR